MNKSFLIKIFCLWVFFLLILSPAVYCAAMSTYLYRGLAAMYDTLTWFLVPIAIFPFFISVARYLHNWI